MDYGLGEIKKLFLRPLICLAAQLA